MRGEQPVLAFNRGMISRLAMARTDLKRYPLSAQEQTNFMPRVLGSAMLRPGFEYLNSSRSDLTAKYLDFVFAVDDTALIELTDLNMRVWVDDEVVTRTSVSTAITNGEFTTDLADWSDEDDGAAVSQWVTGGYMGLTGSGASAACRRQEVVVTAGDLNVPHGLRVVVERGSVEVLVGSTAGADDYFSVTLGVGTHSLAFTPTGTFFIDITSLSAYESLVSSVSIDPGGALTLPTPWTVDDLPLIRKDQSGDVLFIACEGYQQRRIERRGPTSWSVALYETSNGPFRAINTGPITISNTEVTGTTALTASAPLFQEGHVGAMFRLESNGQFTQKTFTAENEQGEKIVVTGVGDTRTFSIVISGTFSATVTLQRSVGDTGTWEDSPSPAGGPWEDTPVTYTAAGTTEFNDSLDNQIIAYRLVVKTGEFTSGSAVAQLRYEYGSGAGLVRITEVTDSLNATAVVLRSLGALGSLGNSATANWYEGSWSDYRGWPSAVALYEGRLWWAGKDKWYGSITDDYANFDPDHEGDAGPIIRSIGSGPVDVINWLLPLQRLMAGTDGSVIAGRSTSFDEPLTAANFNPKASITQGSSRVAATKIDDTGVFVQRGGYRVLSIAPSIEANSNYTPDDLSMLVPEIGKPGIVAIAIQRQPDTRIHCVRSDGKAAVMVYDKAEDVKCWVLVETDGEVEDVVVLPGDDEDAVYYLVKRTIGGATKRYLERWAREDECTGGAVCKLADSFINYTGANLTHLEGEEVVGWYNGVAYDAETVTGGVAAGMPVGAIVGLAYEARFKSTKLAYVAQPGESGIAARKRINSLSLVLADTHPQGIQYGRDFVTMDDLPLQERYQDVDLDAVWDEYNYEAFSLGGEWGVDERLCLKAAAPRPCTLLCAIVGMASNSTT